MQFTVNGDLQRSVREMILVTGGLGFIGNEVVRQIIERGSEIVIVDNENRMAPDIGHISGLRIEKLDITDYSKISRLFSITKPDIVFHLAAIHYIPECNADPERTLRINVEGTSSVLRAAALSGVKKFVFASSGAVYADDPNPLDESSLVQPIDIYGLSKYFGEQLCEWFSRQYEINIIVARLFNNFGPRETNPHIIPEIINQLKQGNTLTLGNIRPVRDYIHTRDTAEALIRLADCCLDPFNIVNVASGNGFSVEELILRIEEILCRKVLVNIDESRFRKADKLVQVADVAKLKYITQWQATVGIDEGLRNLLAFEKLLSA